MPAAKTAKRPAAARPRRLKEERAVYAPSPPTTERKRTKLKELAFHITLPSNADAEAFTDELIALVESHGGAVGGGTVVEDE